MKEKQMASALGWFSIALGLAQLAAPRQLGSAIGAGSHPLLMRTLGLRELASGIGILTQPRPTPWMGSRVAGDAMDLALLGIALVSGGSSRTRLAAATAAVGGVAAADFYTARRLVESEGGLNIRHSVVINRPAEELFRFWRDFENLPRIMPFIESVHVLDPRRSHWVAHTPAGVQVEWDSEVVSEEEGRSIAWRSLETSEVWHAGVIRFEPGRRGTVVRLDMAYRTPLGSIGDVVMRMFQGTLQQEVQLALAPFKQLMETGEITTTHGQSRGTTPPSLIRSLERAVTARSNGRRQLTGETT